MAITPGLAVQIGRAGSSFLGSLLVSRSSTRQQLRREAHVAESKTERRTLRSNAESTPCGVAQND
jgi:hypothetical protein